VADWGTHDPDRAGPRYFPAGLEEEITAAVGRDPVGICDIYGNAGKLEELRDGLLERIEKKERIIAGMLDKGGWDLLAGVFPECHCAGHQFWHLHDASHPRHDPRLAAELGDVLLEVYRAVDASLGRLLARAGDETRVFVYCSHGMGPRYDATASLDEVLRRLDGMAPSRAPLWRDVSVWVRDKVPWRRLLPNRMRMSGRKMARSLEESSLARDRAGRTCFQVVTSSVFGGIRINLRGREPDGKVAPGAEYEALCDALEGDLLALLNGKTGRPAVRAVHRTDRLHPGKYRDGFPDLWVEWAKEAEITSLVSPKIGKVRGRHPDARTGDHRADGLFLARGRGIAPGAGAAISVVDIAPTVAAALGVELDDVDGRPIPEVAGPGKARRAETELGVSS
jgi:predicted AlkP superfamily phosphohydrolase/phosphomutase